MNNLLLIGLTPINVGTVDIGSNDEKICVKRCREHGTCQILVNDSFSTYEAAILIEIGRNAAPAAANDDVAVFHQSLERCKSPNTFRIRARYDSAPLVVIGSNGPAVLFGELFGLFFLVDGADWFGRVLKGRIIWINLCLRENSG